MGQMYTKMRGTHIIWSEATMFWPFINKKDFFGYEPVYFNQKFVMGIGDGLLAILAASSNVILNLLLIVQIL
jgi:hypothetical protein